VARPRKKEGELYSERVPVRLKPRDKEHLDRIAEERGIPASIVAREVLMDYIARHEAAPTQEHSPRIDPPR